MALLSKFKLPGAFGSIPAYFMVTGITHDRVQNAARVDLGVFTDAASRSAFKAAAASIPMIQAAADTKMEAAQALAEGTPERAQLELEIQQFKLDFSTAQKVMSDNGFINDQGVVNIGPDKIADVLTDGHVDLAKVYGYLMKLPRFDGATEV